MPSDLRIQVKKLPAEIAGVVLKLVTAPDEPPEELLLEEVLLEDEPDEEPLEVLAVGSLPPPPPHADKASAVIKHTD